MRATHTGSTAKVYPEPRAELVADHPPQARYVGAQAREGALRRVVTPEGVEQRVDRHHFTDVGEEHGEDAALVGATDEDGVVAVEQLDGAQDPEPHTATLGRTPHRGVLGAITVRSRCDDAATGNPHPVPMTLASEPEITTGWESDLPVGDTLVRRFLFHNSELAATFARAAAGRVVESEAISASDLRRPSGYWNQATLLQPPSDWDETIDVVEAFFVGGTGKAMLWSAWPTPDLRPHGWTLSGHPPLLVRPPAGYLTPPAGSSAGVREVTTVSELVEWERVAIDGYPLPELAGAAPGTMARSTLLDAAAALLWTAASTASR